MIAAWILYVLVVTALVAGAALAVERALPADTGRLRAGWVAALGALPLLLLLPPPDPAVAAGVGAGLLAGAGAVVAGGRLGWERLVGGGTRSGGGVEVGAPLGGEAAGPALMAQEAGGMAARFLEAVGEGLSALSPWLLAAWLAGSGFLAFRLVRGVLHLRRASARWPRSQVGEVEVLVSEDVGPGLLGVFRARTVLPAWCLSLAPEDRELVVAHEEEHRRAGDALLLALSRTLLVLVPWNLPLWWMDRRLRTAVELDCDVRVARRHPGDRKRYAYLLVAAAARARLHPRVRPVAHLALFAEPRSPLHRRIAMLTRSDTHPSRPRSLALLLGAAGLLGLAFLVPGCDADQFGSDAHAGEAEITRATATQAPAEPSFTPYTAAPEVRNRAAVTRALEREYPPLLRDAGVGGTALLFFFIDETGQVGDVRIHEGSGHHALDEAALRVGQVFEFSPAMNRDEPVPVWIQLPITFTTRTGEEAAEVQADEAPAAPASAGAPSAPARTEGVTAEGTRGLTPPSASDDPDGPAFTPFTVAPEVRNRQEVSQALAAAYPALLRDAGVGGTAIVYFHIDATGAVQDLRIHESSGHEALDQAALRVGEVFQFSPAMNRDQRVPVWIQIPITFTTR